MAALVASCAKNLFFHVFEEEMRSIVDEFQPVLVIVQMDGVSVFDDLCNLDGCFVPI